MTWTHRYLPVWLAFLTVGCRNVQVSCPNGEAILFSKVGNAFFEDSVCVVCPDGSGVRTLLARRVDRSFLSATGNSLQSWLAVTAHHLTPDRRVENHLYVFRPSTGDLRPWPNLTGEQAIAAAAADDIHIAFEFASSRAGPVRLRVADLMAGEMGQVPNEGDLSDRYPCWSPDGREILFLRVRISPSSTPMQTTLMRVTFPPSKPVVVFGPEEAVSSAAYAPDGKRFAIWSRNGIEVVDRDSLKRRVVFSISSLQGRKPGNAGLIWARRSDILAFALSNPQTSESELWTVQADGNSAQRIFAARDGSIRVGSFVLE